MKRSILRSLALGLVAVAPTATYFAAPGVAHANLGFETGVVSGNITRSDGTPVAYAEVQINATDGSGTAWTSTDADGNYTLEVPTGDYDITPIYPEFWTPIGTSTVTVTQGATSTADFVQAVGTLSGSLLRTNGDAFTRAEVWLSSDTGGGGSLQVNPDGSFSQSIPVGDWNLSGRYNGYPVATGAASVSLGGTATANLSFPSGEVTTSVTANGQPETRARMWVSQNHDFDGTCPADAETTCEWYEPADPNGPPEMQDACHGCTDGNGRRYNCEMDGWCWYEEAFYGDAQADENGNIALVLPVGQFNGQVQVEYWEDQADPQQPGGEYPYWGNFTFDDFSVAVTDQSVEARAPVAYSTGSVGGTVTLDGAPVPHTQIEFNAIGSFYGWAYTQTDENGLYNIDLPDGDYELRAWGNGLNVEGVYLTVTAGGSEIADLNETSQGTGGPGSFLRGTVLRNGQPQPNVHVWVMDSTPAPTSCPADPATCEWHDAQHWPEGEEPPPEDIHCDRCDDGNGRFYSCHGGTECWWEEVYNVNATTAADGTWSVAAPANPYRVTLHDQIYGDPQQNPEGEAGDFWSEFQLTTYDVVLGENDDQDLGTYAYDTGFVTGAVTSCGEPEYNASANLYNDKGWSWSWSGQDASFYMEVPAGTYDASIDYGFAHHQWPTQVTVTAGATETLDHAFEGHGVLAGFVSSNGTPVQNARVEIQEPPPTGCNMEGANCWELEPEFCHCEFEGRGFECWSHDPGMPEMQECYWWDGGGSQAYTGPDGTFSARVRPGQYNVTAYTPEVYNDPQDPEGDPGMGGGGGSFVIGTFQANVFTCQTAEVGAADTPIEAIPPGGTSTVELTTDLTIELASADGAEAGTVSFVATNEEPIDEQPPGLIEVASLYYDFTSTVQFDEATICIPYDETTLTVPEADLKMLHYDDQLDPPEWVDVTTSVDTTNDIVCGVAPHFSWYVLAQVEVTDNDGDGVEQDVDNCPDTANADQADLDGDGQGDVCDDDIDGDEVFNAFDDCAATPLDNLVDDNGCDSAQRLDATCPANGNYKNHGKYVSCVSNETDEQVTLGMLTAAEADAIVSEAARSSVGKTKGK